VPGCRALCITPWPRPRVAARLRARLAASGIAAVDFFASAVAYRLVACGCRRLARCSVGTAFAFRPSASAAASASPARPWPWVGQRPGAPQRLDVLRAPSQLSAFAMPGRSQRSVAVGLQAELASSPRRHLDFEERSRDCANRLPLLPNNPRNGGRRSLASRYPSYLPQTAARAPIFSEVARGLLYLEIALDESGQVLRAASGIRSASAIRLEPRNVQTERRRKRIIAAGDPWVRPPERPA